MLFWQDGSFLGRATQLDPYTISGYMVALLAMLLLLQELMSFGKKHVSGVGGKENKNAICGVYVMPVFQCC